MTIDGKSKSQLFSNKWMNDKKNDNSSNSSSSSYQQLYNNRRWGVLHIHSPLGVSVVSTLLNKYTSSKNISKTIFNSPKISMGWYGFMYCFNTQHHFLLCFRIDEFICKYSDAILPFKHITKNTCVKLKI